MVRAKDIPKITAIAGVWCGNTVRLQASQYVVTPNGRTCDYGLLCRALDVEAHHAEPLTSLRQLLEQGPVVLG